MDAIIWFLLAVLAVLNIAQRTVIVRMHKRLIAERAKTTHAEGRLPPTSALLDVSSVWERPHDDPEHMLLVKFKHVDTMSHFHHWLRYQIHEVRDYTVRE